MRDEYVVVGEGAQKTWEKIGAKNIDLSEYKTYADTKTSLSGDGYATGVKVNGATKNSVDGVVDIGTAVPYTEDKNSAFTAVTIGDRSTQSKSDVGAKSLAVGGSTKASGENSVAFGNWTTASGLNSVAAGNLSEATGSGSNAEGN